MSENKVQFDLRVGLLDISFAQLLTKDHHLIEFPTLLLPEDVQAGSIVRITCERDVAQEAEDEKVFVKTQDMILEQFTSHLPKRPVLRAINITQTTLVLGWDPIDIGTAEIESLSLYKNDQQLGRIPTPLKRTATKLSNLAIDSEYTFHLVLRTSAGTFESDKLQIKTHRMTDLSGITICVGSLEDSEISREDLIETIERLGAKPIQDSVKLDTTHFVCTKDEGRQIQRAKDLSIPIVRPEWLRACEMERRLVGVRQYYLTADPRLLPPVVARNILATPVRADSGSHGTDSSESEDEQNEQNEQNEPDNELKKENETGPAESETAPATVEEQTEAEAAKKDENFGESEAKPEPEAVEPSLSNEPEAEQLQDEEQNEEPEPLPESEPLSESEPLPESEPLSESEPLPESTVEVIAEPISEPPQTEPESTVEVVSEPEDSEHEAEDPDVTGITVEKQDDPTPERPELKSPLYTASTEDISITTSAAAAVAASSTPEANPLGSTSSLKSISAASLPETANPSLAESSLVDVSLGDSATTIPVAAEAEDQEEDDDDANQFKSVGSGGNQANNSGKKSKKKKNKKKH